MKAQCLDDPVGFWRFSQPLFSAFIEITFEVRGFLDRKIPLLLRAHGGHGLDGSGAARRSEARDDRDEYGST